MSNIKYQTQSNIQIRMSNIEYQTQYSTFKLNVKYRIQTQSKCRDIEFDIEFDISNVGSNLIQHSNLNVEYEYIKLESHIQI